MKYIFCNHPELIEQAVAFADPLGLTLIKEKPSQGLFLELNKEGLFLSNHQTTLTIDFLSKETKRRFNSFGQNQPLGKAVNLKQKPKILDATAGLARDAFLLAASGCDVTLIEQSPILATMINVALEKAQNERPEIIDHMHLVQGDSVKWIESSNETFDVIYLDPMFPERKKSALVKKDMQLLQELLGHTDNAETLLAMALNKATHRVVLKRPRHALLIQEPDFQILSKTHRFDVFITSGLRIRASM